MPSLLVCFLSIFIFPTWQVRVVRIYVSCLPPSSPSPLPAPPPRQLRMAVFPAGPQQQVQDGSVPRRTSTANSARQHSLPDLNREFRLAVFPDSPPDLNRELPLIVFAAGPHRELRNRGHNTQPHNMTTNAQSTSTITNTQPQTRNHKPNHKHNHTTTHTTTNTQPQTQLQTHSRKHTNTNT